MKKNKLITIVLTLALVLVFASAAVPAAFADNSVTVYVTIANGTPVLTEKAITVTDTDGDGALTINDVLVLAHDAAYDGGAAAGYASANGTYGLAITKLWGVENGGSYGYYVNNKSAMGLSDKVADGDHVYAFIYTDTVGFSDIYCYFDNFSVSAAKGESVTLTLLSAGYDANWQPVTTPVSGAAITIDGKKTEYVTDAEGKVTVSFADAGKHTVSATHDTVRMVPPVLTADITDASSPVTGDRAMTVVCAAVAAMGIFSVALVGIRKADEK